MIKKRKFAGEIRPGKVPEGNLPQFDDNLSLLLHNNQRREPGISRELLSDIRRSRCLPHLGDNFVRDLPLRGLQGQGPTENRALESADARKFRR